MRIEDKRIGGQKDRWTEDRGHRIEDRRKRG